VVTAPELLERELEKRVLTLWSGVLGVETGSLDRDGPVMVVDPRDFAAQRRATIQTARGTLITRSRRRQRSRRAGNTF
jgi:hypothetical protein